MTTSLHVHLEPVGGIAGDMFVAAMMDLFPQQREACWQDLHDCGVMDQVDVGLQTGVSKGMAVHRLHVSLKHKPARRTGNYRDLRQWLAGSLLEEGVKARSQAILLLLAQAEAQVHGVDVEQVHFHEVADWDSIVDIVAAASLIERAGAVSWSCAPLPLGSGLVQTEHGLLPVPAPATAVLLQQLTVWDDGEVGERVTPTGAAILRSLWETDAGIPSNHVSKPRGTLLGTGCGAGQRELQHRPNVLRCLLIDTAIAAMPEGDEQNSFMPVSVPVAVSGLLVDEVVQLSFDIDDMTPEELSVSLEYLRSESGVLDVHFQLALGKKGRAMFAVTVLCRPECEAALSARCLEETSTLGLRVQRVYRRTLERQLHTVTDEGKPAGIKAVTRPSGLTSVKVESDDLAGTPGLQARRRRENRLRESFQS